MNKWIERNQIVSDMCYGIAGGLDALGYRDLARILARAGWFYARHLPWLGRLWRWVAYQGMDRALWQDIATMAHYRRIDAARGKALLGG